MTCYRLDNDFSNYWSFTIDSVELFSKMPNYSPRFNGVSKLESWVAPNAGFYASDNYGVDNTREQTINIPDITTWVLGCLILNEKAYIALKGVLAPSGEFLEAYCEGIPYFIFNNLHIEDDSAVDTGHSEKCIVDGIFQGVDALAFIESKISQPIFKTTFDRKAYSYCTDIFKEAVLNADLKGLIFNEALV